MWASGKCNDFIAIDTSAWLVELVAWKLKKLLLFGAMFQKLTFSCMYSSFLGKPGQIFCFGELVPLIGQCPLFYLTVFARASEHEK